MEIQKCDTLQKISLCLIAFEGTTEQGTNSEDPKLTHQVSLWIPSECNWPKCVFRRKVHLQEKLLKIKRDKLLFIPKFVTFIVSNFIF